MKHDIEFREQKDILAEITALKKQGIEHFRLGKQSCFYSYKNGKVSEIEKLLKPIKAKTLHIDNVNPNNVISEDGIKITKLVIKYCTPGNVAAFGIESFDKEVIKRNHLNTRPETAFKAIQILNKYGAKTSPNGMPYLLPGINILFGLIGETKKTFEANYHWLKKILDHNLLIRRINIRQVVPFPGTYLYIEAGNKFLRKNRKHYWKWRNTIRQDIDYPMLKRLLPIGSVMKDVYTEIYDGKTTFGRQLGTYPLIVGIKGRHELNKFVNIKVTNHMLRSVTGEII
jgi:radical SAM superfamily enzyme with C-terminal helix-hairpin-helix motif